MTSFLSIECGNCGVLLNIGQYLPIRLMECIVGLVCPECNKQVEMYGIPINGSTHRWAGDRQVIVTEQEYTYANV